MPKNVNAYTRFLPLPSGAKKVITKNDSYFNLIFLGGNYFSKGNILQTIFGGRDEVALIAGLRLPPDGHLITTVEEPNIVIDKRTIKTGRITNIPMVLNLLVKIPAYMNSIGFSFKIATLKKVDNFSVALDVLNDSANKTIVEGFLPGVVGKALGVGKVVKDLFDKIDATNGNNLLQLVVNDFIVPANADDTGSNLLQEGFLVVFVKNENNNSEESENYALKDGDQASQKDLAFSATKDAGYDEDEKVVFLDTSLLEEPPLLYSKGAGISDINDLVYDEAKKELRLNGEKIGNTYLIFKIQHVAERGEDLNTNWSKKFAQAVALLADEMDKTRDRLEVLKPQLMQYLNEANALLSEDQSYTPAEKKNIKGNYMTSIENEKRKFI